MHKMILASFDDSEQVSRIIDTLSDNGYEKEHISIITGSKSIVREEYGSKGEEVVEGAGTGAIVGGLAGLLLSVLGIFIIGPISIALGLAGIAGTTVTGAVIGATAGGLIGLLTKIGVPRETAEKYEDTVKSGGTVIGVSGDDLSEARTIFESEDARDIAEIEIKSDKE